MFLLLIIKEFLLRTTKFNCIWITLSTEMFNLYWFLIFSLQHVYKENQLVLQRPLLCATNEWYNECRDCYRMPKLTAINYAQVVYLVRDVRKKSNKKLLEIAFHRCDLCNSIQFLFPVTRVAGMYKNAYVVQF